MNTLLLFLALFQAAPAIKNLPLPRLDRILIGTVGATRIEDAASTRYCLTHGAHELILPNWIAGNTPTMYTFSIGMTLLQYEASKFLIRRGHHKLAIASELFNAGSTGLAATHNWIGCTQ